MTLPKPITGCSLCGHTESIQKVEGITPCLPAGWATVTLHELGDRIRNFVLCKACTRVVRQQMGGLSAAHRDAVVAQS